MLDRHFFVSWISFAWAASAQTCVSSRAGVTFWGALRRAVLWMGRSGAHAARIAVCVGASLSFELNKLGQSRADALCRPISRICQRQGDKSSQLA
jgi:hypothetical protein